MNPFRLIPRILGWTLGILFAGLVLYLIAFVGVKQFDAWWGAVLMPVIAVVALVLLILIFVLLGVLFDWLARRWRSAEVSWDNKRARKDS